MLVRKIMSSPVISATDATTIREAAERMRDEDLGALPFFRNHEILGIVIDRDIVIRALGAVGFALGPDTSVARIMSRDVLTCFDDDEVKEAAALMGEQRMRCLLVFDRSGATVGILSLGDIAEHASEELAGVPGHGYETARCADYAAILTPVAASGSRAFCSALI